MTRNSRTPKIKLIHKFNSLFKCIHTSFRQVQSDPTVHPIFPFAIDHRAMTPCRETNNYWSDPKSCFLPYPIRPVNTNFWDIKLQIVKSLHLSNTSPEVSESSPSTSKILRQSLLPYCSKSSHFLTRQEDTVLETSNKFSRSMRDSSSLSIFSFYDLTVLLSLESNSTALEPVPLCQICSHQKLIDEFYHPSKFSSL